MTRWLVFLLFCSCHLFTKTVYVPVETPPKCLKDPPPDLEPWLSDGPEEGCPEPWEVCLRKQDVGKLIANYEKLIIRVKEDWTRCGPSPSSQPSP